MMRVFMIFDNSLKLNIVLDSEALSGALQYRVLVKGSVIWKQFLWKMNRSLWTQPPKTISWDNYIERIHYRDEILMKLQSGGWNGAY